jgi:hypothetical protein
LRLSNTLDVLSTIDGFLEALKDAAPAAADRLVEEFSFEPEFLSDGDKDGGLAKLEDEPLLFIRFLSCFVWLGAFLERQEGRQNTKGLGSKPN